MAKYELKDYVRFRFLRGRAGKVVLGPHKPLADMLIFRQQLVRPSDNSSSIDSGSTQEQHGSGNGIATTRKRQNQAVFNPWLRSQRVFEILRVDVHAFRC